MRRGGHRFAHLIERLPGIHFPRKDAKKVLKKEAKVAKEGLHDGRGARKAKRSDWRVVKLGTDQICPTGIGRVKTLPQNLRPAERGSLSLRSVRL